MAGLGRRVWAADEILSADDLQDYIQDQVVFVYNDASARSSGILAPTEGMVSYLKNTNLLYIFDGSSWVEVAPDVGTPGTYTKVTTDFKGRVTSGTTLSAGDIPTIDVGSQTSGTLAVARGGTGATDAGGARTNLGITAANVPSSSGASNVQADLSFLSSSKLNNTGPQTFSGALGVSGDFSMGGAMFNGQTYNQTNTGRAVFVASNGLFGIGSSSERFKKNIVDAEIDIDAVRKIVVRNFQYKEDFSSDDSIQIGVIAEELMSLGLSEFVYFNNDGEPDGVAYEKLALALLPLVQSQADRLDVIESRLSKLEK